MLSQLLKLTLVFFMATLMISCNEDNTTTTSEPANLVLEVVLGENNSGLVDVVVSAENAVEYSFDPGVGDIDPITNTTGVFNHEYLLTGVYLIEVRAIGTSGRFIKKTKQITVQVGDVNEPINGEDGYITPLSYEGMTLIWQDEFNGSALDQSYWNFETGRGSGGWGNNELQYYRTDNTKVEKGFLTIEAKNETFSGAQYTSSRLTTQDKFEFQYGRVDIRAKLPKGQGLWPALWLLGENIGSVGWPACGEIDIMEMIGGGEGRDNTTHGTVHWDNNGSYASYGTSKKLASGLLNDKFHVFTLVWNASSIRWYLDDVQFNVVDITPAALSEFHNEFFLIFNVAVGGNWPGSPNSSTNFPQHMNVDYVRVFQNN